MSNKKGEGVEKGERTDGEQIGRVRDVRRGE